jgi:hypothetical protein
MAAGEGFGQSGPLDRSRIPQPAKSEFARELDDEVPF